MSSWKNSYPRCRAEVWTNLRINCCSTCATVSLQWIPGFWKYPYATSDPWGGRQLRFRCLVYQTTAYYFSSRRQIDWESKIGYWSNLRCLRALNPSKLQICSLLEILVKLDDILVMSKTKQVYERFRQKNNVYTSTEPHSTPRKFLESAFQIQLEDTGHWLKE